MQIVYPILSDEDLNKYNSMISEHQGYFMDGDHKLISTKYPIPFGHLKSYFNGFQYFSEEFNKWCNIYWDFELTLQGEEQKELWILKMRQLMPDLTIDIALQFLGKLGWRERFNGGYLAALGNYCELTEIMGVHLIKSESIIAARAYLIALTKFNTDISRSYIEEYLNYYLLKPDLHFDQHLAISALQYLDEVNGTRYIDQFQDKWKAYQMKIPSNHIKQIDPSLFAKQIDIINKIHT